MINTELQMTKIISLAINYPFLNQSDDLTNKKMKANKNETNENFKRLNALLVHNQTWDNILQDTVGCGLFAENSKRAESSHHHKVIQETFDILGD